MRAKAAYIYVRGEFWHESNCLQKAVDEVKARLRRRTLRDFWGKMHVGQVMTSMCMSTTALVLISAERRQD